MQIDTSLQEPFSYSIYPVIFFFVLLFLCELVSGHKILVFIIIMYLCSAFQIFRVSNKGNLTVLFFI